MRVGLGQGTKWIAPVIASGKCSNCHEIICVEKAVTDGPSTQLETSEMLHKAFRTHVRLKHSEDVSQSAASATERYDA
jgi:hypothetical protein